MSEFTPTPEFEKRVSQVLDVPGPSAAFSNALRARLIARSSEMKPQTSLRPVWRIAFALTALIVFLLVVFNLPGVATAMKTLFGYLPGVGPVSQDAPLRVLAELVSITRDGYTVTVEKVLASADKTTLDYRISNIPADAYYGGYDPQPGCRIQLHLPNGNQLDTDDGYSGSSEGTGTISGQYSFPPIPADVNELVFWLPCIDQLDHEQTPSDWKIPLRLAPAPSDLILVPIIEVQPTEIGLPATVQPDAPTPTPTSAPVTPAELTLEQVIPALEGYILVGSFSLLDQPASTHLGDWFYLEDGIVTDASGQEIPFSASPNGYGFADLNDSFRPLDDIVQNGRWAIQIQPAEFDWPITFTVRSSQAVSRCDPAKFEFDTGPSPQIGQEWKLDKDLELCNGQQVHLISAFLRSADRYDITYTTGIPNLRHLWFEFEGHGPHGGGGWCEGDGTCFTGVQYNGGAPSGKLTAVLTGELDIILEGPWQIQWQPEE
jgi:hypothetical protein